MAHRIKVKVKWEFKHESMAAILPVGFETTLEPTYANDKFEGFVLKVKGGSVIHEREIYRFIGNQPLSKIFDKL